MRGYRNYLPYQGAKERKPSERQVRLEALLPDYAARLSRKGMTVKKLYEEYHTGHPDGYLKASFGMKLRQFMLQTNAIGHVEHRAGDGCISILPETDWK